MQNRSDSGTDVRVDDQPVEPSVRTEITGHVATITLNRPDKFNALSEELLTELQQTLDSIRSNDQIRVVVLAATGRAFCAGHDLRQMRSNHGQDYYQRLFKRCSAMMQTIHALPQPVIASVQGIATAAGCQLVATCDLAVASNEARFAVSGVNLGLFCSTPSVALSRNIARKRAFEMLVTGDFIDAATALEYGLVNKVTDAENLAAVSDELANKIASKPPVAIRAGKALFYQQLQQDLTTAYSNAGDVMACNMMADQTIEGVDAFLEKRPPDFDKFER